MVILDFSKAFDTIPHNKLLYKLKQYGINVNTLKWIDNFLKQKSKSSSGYENPHWHMLIVEFPKEQYLNHYYFSYTYMTSQNQSHHM